MAISITLTHSITETQKGTVKLDLSTTAEDISPKVFAIEVLPRSKDSLAPIYRFSHICSPSELVEFPDEEAEDNCYFRTDEISMIFDTAQMALLTLNHVKSDISRLVSEYRALENAETSTSSVIF